MNERSPHTAVLVHGAWADGSCWSNVIGPLQKVGLNVIAAPLPLTSLNDDTDALQRVLERTTGSVTLVAHAYAGAVIGSASNERVSSLVFIAALAPAEGETVADVFYRASPHPQAPHLQPDPHGFIWMPEEGFRSAVAHEASPDQLAIMSVVQRPIAVRCIQEQVQLPSWRRTPSWYLVAEKDRMIIPDTQRFMAARMSATIRTHDVDHSPMYTAPESVVELIIEAVGEDSAK